MRTTRAALLLASTTAAAALATPGPAALADTGAGAQNPALAVTGALTRVVRPDAGTDELFGSFNVTFKGKVTRRVTLCGTIIPPNNGTRTTVCDTYRMKPGDMRSDAVSSALTPSSPRGTYTLRVRATTTNGLGASTATSTLQVI